MGKMSEAAQKQKLGMSQLLGSKYWYVMWCVV